MHKTRVPWLFVGIPTRSDMNVAPWMKPITDLLAEDNGNLHKQLKVACVTYRNGGEDKNGVCKPMKKGPNYDAIFWDCLVVYKDKDDMTARWLGDNLANGLTKIVKENNAVSL